MIHHELLSCAGRPELPGCSRELRRLGSYWQVVTPRKVWRAHVNVCDGCGVYLDVLMTPRGWVLTSQYPREVTK